MTLADLRVPAVAGLDLRPEHQHLPNPYAAVTRCDLTASRADGELVVTDLPTVEVRLGGGEWTANWFTSDWGDEFTPQQEVVTAPLHLGIRTGRSSKGMHPWLCLTRQDGHAVVVSPAWSGNWRIDVEPVPDGLVVRAGISPWAFARTVRPGRAFRAPSVYVAEADTADAATAGLASAASRWVTPRTPDFPLTWNHWWPYEDQEIDEATFLANAGVARDLGYDLAVLDAGWFGGADAGSFWWQVRGDWAEENTVRFPPAGRQDWPRQRERRVSPSASGARWRRSGTTPWWLRGTPSWSPAATTIRGSTAPARMIQAGWAMSAWARRKVAPMSWTPSTGWSHAPAHAGSRSTSTSIPAPDAPATDHGHEAGDGLYEHYCGLYEVLDQLRARAPPSWSSRDCSSGGLRLDLGLLGHVHCGFLSDPDWTEFQLQLLWGVSKMLPAASIFHFSESQWRTHPPAPAARPEDALAGRLRRLPARP